MCKQRNPSLSANQLNMLHGKNALKILPRFEASTKRPGGDKLLYMALCGPKTTTCLQTRQQFCKFYLQGSFITSAIAFSRYLALVRNILTGLNLKFKFN